MLDGDQQAVAGTAVLPGKACPEAQLFADISAGAVPKLAARLGVSEPSLVSAMQLAMSLGRNSVKEHLGRISSARKGLTPASYWLQRAMKRGLVTEEQAEGLRAQLVALANRLDEHAQTVVQETNRKIEDKKRQPKKDESAAANVETTNVSAEKTAAH